MPQDGRRGVPQDGMRGVPQDGRRGVKKLKKFLTFDTFFCC